jgi:hypothetical protein
VGNAGDDRGRCVCRFGEGEGGGEERSHELDKPLNHTNGGGVLGNFTRLETFGARNTQWVSARIDAGDPNLFIFEPRIVPANSN